MIQQLQVKFQHKSRGCSGIVNSDSGIVNTYSGERQKTFTFEQNRCSRSIRIAVHVRPEWVFTLVQNMQGGFLWVRVPPITNEAKL
jgi:hypothetical protein